MTWHTRSIGVLHFCSKKATFLTLYGSSGPTWAGVCFRYKAQWGTFPMMLACLGMQNPPLRSSRFPFCHCTRTQNLIMNSRKDSVFERGSNLAKGDAVISGGVKWRNDVPEELCNLTKSSKYWPCANQLKDCVSKQTDNSTNTFTHFLPFPLDNSMCNMYIMLLQKSSTHILVDRNQTRYVLI